ncbi:DUF2442 domain-containing protein [Microbulbifer thermotolerans]|uniref:DUF2442 domain-containing protein n=1 Tax=Microbulbifer thermotolerans TaxID=252514 RepID=A0A143HIC6_MICTH|nr:DUF2442 domain-containing protein [Microbulbifer thermotolerans]AMX01257.1 hypothetical protein A3224_00490 [Microbulbifer thermotolerans]MCX2835080.1 DUF2442 domain-containing protein [Microbulbifer thermotolerans]
MADLDAMTITNFKLVGNYTIEITFKDGKVQTINFEPVIGKGWMKQLLDQNYFNKVKLNDGGNLEWPDGQDFNPEALYEWERFEKLYIEDARRQ